MQVVASAIAASTLPANVSRELPREIQVELMAASRGRHRVATGCRGGVKAAAAAEQRERSQRSAEATVDDPCSCFSCACAPASWQGLARATLASKTWRGSLAHLLQQGLESKITLLWPQHRQKA